MAETEKIDDDSFTGSCPTCHQEYYERDLTLIRQRLDGIEQHLGDHREVIGNQDKYLIRLRNMVQALVSNLTRKDQRAFEKRFK